MTSLSVNINKIALLRNARGRDYPNVLAFSRQFLAHGAHGITLHPRPDQRHATWQDCRDLKRLCDEQGAELNIEGNPTDEFLAVVRDVRPAQCTLVPDAPAQLTSDHGWDVRRDAEHLRRVCHELRDLDVRVSVFIDHDNAEIERVAELGAQRIELYTEPYAASYGTPQHAAMLAQFASAAQRAQQAGLGVNAGHDLSLDNLAAFVAAVPNVLEVSIGHALVVECMEQGLAQAMAGYGRILVGR